MRFLFFGFLALTTILTGSSGTLPGSSGAQSQQQSDSTLNQLLSQLRSDSFSDRQAASRELAKIGFAAVPHLIDKVVAGDPESAYRSAQILDHIAMGSTEDSALRIARIYHLLAENGYAHFRGKSQQMRERWKQQRVQQTLTRLRSLGVTIEEVGEQQIFLDSFVFDEFGGPAASDPQPSPSADVAPTLSPRQVAAAIKEILSATDEENQQLFEAEVAAVETDVKPSKPGGQVIVDGRRLIRLEARGGVIVAGGGLLSADSNSQSTYLVTLDNKWKGSDQQLELFALLPGVSVFNINSRHVSAELFLALRRISSLQMLQFTEATFELTDALAFMRARPGVNVQVTGKAFLGVTAENVTDADAPGCRIQSVVADSAAQRAELKPGEIIQAVDGESLATFQQLVVAIATFAPGEKASLSIKTDDGVKTVEVTLGERPDSLLIPIDDNDDP